MTTIKGIGRYVSCDVVTRVATSETLKYIKR